LPAEIQYDMRDPFTQKVVIGRGSQQGVQDGSPVVSEDGIIGQVTRVFPMQSEVTLLTDKDQAVPVQIVRTGLRGVVYGLPAAHALELRFVPISADIVAGDELVTSGLDGVYPQGLPVAKVVRVDKVADTAFARVICEPVAAVHGARDVLVLRYQSGIPPRPEPQPDPAKETKGKKASKGADKGTDKGVDKGVDKGAKNGKTEKGESAGEAGSATQAASASDAARTQAVATGTARPNDRAVDKAVDGTVANAVTQAATKAAGHAVEKTVGQSSARSANAPGGHAGAAHLAPAAPRTASGATR
jgi:rod shape-determining protein MreC